MERGRLLARRILRSEKVRFGLVGGVNTSVDFVVLFILARLFGVPAILANVISTSCAVAVSYVLNKKAVFGDADRNNRRQLILFIVVTLTGLWVLQSFVIASVTTALAGLTHDSWVLFAAKVVATVSTLVWNYLWYSRVVFRRK